MNSEDKIVRVVAVQPAAITGVEFYSGASCSRCACSQFAFAAGPRAPLPQGLSPVGEGVLDGVGTNNRNIGSSCAGKNLPDETEARGLTQEEVNAAKIVFKNSIDYGKVRIHKGGLFDIPTRHHVLLTPDGEIHVPSGMFCENYFGDSEVKKDNGKPVDVQDKFLIIHEMAHVWQYQSGYPVKRAAEYLAAVAGYFPSVDHIPILRAYRFDLKEEKDGKREFAGFNIEQQADLIALYFWETVLHADMGNYSNRFKAYLAEYHDLAHLKRVLAPFLLNPAKINEKNLFNHNLFVNPVVIMNSFPSTPISIPDKTV